MSSSWGPTPLPPETSGASRQVGPYLLLRRLGSGGMGEVFLARDLRLDRLVAIKHPHAGAASEAQRARFRREAWAAARLAHPAIIPIFDVLSDPDGDWIVMEYVDGPSLRQHLQQHGRPGLALALAWAAQIADGLAAAHDKGIVHRDLKAENLMVAPSGHLKIVDFGLAKSFSEADPEVALSASGAVLGTLRSMAPEQARGQQVDWRADLFSFGVLLYELLTGISPFAAASPVEILSRLAALPHTRVAAVCPGIPPALESLVDQLLAKAPEARPASARQVATKLREILAQIGPLAASGSGGAETAAEAATQNETPADPALAATAFEALLAAPHPEPSPEPGAGQRARQRRRGLMAALAIAAIAALTWAAVETIRRGNGAHPGEIASATARGTQAGEPAGAAAPEIANEPLALLKAGRDQLEHWYRPGHLDAAIGYFQRALLLEPRSPTLLAGLSQAYWYRSKAAGRDEQSLRQALAVAERAVAIEKNLASAQLGLGLAALELGELTTAETALGRAELLEKNAAAAYGRGLLAKARGDLAGAAAAYRQSLDREPTAEVANALGSLLLRQNRGSEAEAAFRQAIALAPDAIFGHRNLASALFARGDSAGAAAELQRAIEIEPRASLYTNLGTLFFYQGLYADAQLAYQQAIDKAGEEGIATNTALLWANLGDSYRFLPDHQNDARLAFRRAVQLIRAEAAAQPRSAELRSRLGLYLAKAGDPAGAHHELAATLALPNLENQARLRVVFAYEALGERPAALAALAQALRAGVTLSEIEREPELRALRADPAYHRLAASTH